MNEPWFDPIAWAWLPGTIHGCLEGLWGAIGCGFFASRGKQRTLVLGSGIALLAAAVIFLVAGLTALLLGQPYGIWYGFLLPGVGGIILMPILLLVIRIPYREAEERRIQATDLD